MKTLAALAAFMAALAAHAGNLADVRIHERAAQCELPLHRHDGRAYVVGHPGNEYEIVIRNRTGEDLLAVVSVDGVNVVSGETAGTRQAGYVLGPWETTRIAGWRKSLAETAAFYFTELGDAYAARTGRPDHVGVIGVALFQRRVPPRSITAPLRSEARSRDAAAERAAPASPAAAAALGTGHGRREDSPARHVAFERRTREPVEILAIHYDSRANLAARGILPPAHGRRAPDPFPAHFVPDP